MKTLAIDTSLHVGSVAAADGVRTIEIVLPVTGEHARRIGSALAEAAHGLGWRIGEVDLVGAVRGPGSFTGLRVGLATAKAIAWAAEAALVGVSGFDVVARRTAALCDATDRPLHVAFDAGRGELFVTEMRPADDAPTGFRSAPPRLVSAVAWEAGLPAGALVSGPGLDIVTASGSGRTDIQIAPREAWRPTAADVIDLARRLHAAGAHDSAAALVPDYIRPSYADESAARPA